MLNETELRALSRSQLQKLAKEHDLKANAKSETIIANLLEIFAPQLLQSRPSTPSGKGNRGRAGDARLRLRAPSPRTKSPDYLPTTPTRSAGEPVAVLSDGSPQLSAQPDHCSSDSASTPRFYSPESSTEPDVPLTLRIQKTDQQFAAIEKIQIELLDSIKLLQKKTEKCNARTEVVRTMISAEAARRNRIKTYITYWMPAESEWPGADLYGENFIMPESVLAIKRDKRKILTTPEREVLREAESRNVILLYGKDSDKEALQKLPTTPKKRQHEAVDGAEDEDEIRYQRRSKSISPTSPLTRYSAREKGKGRAVNPTLSPGATLQDAIGSFEEEQSIVEMLTPVAERDFVIEDDGKAPATESPKVTTPVRPVRIRTSRRILRSQK